MNISERDFNTLFLCTFRYAIERDTGIAMEFRELLKGYKDNILPWVRDQIKRDVMHKIETDNFKSDWHAEQWERFLYEMV